MAKVLKYGDVSKVESDFKPAPVGVYHAKVESIEQVASKSSGDQQFEVIFTPTKDANGKKLKQQYGRLWYYAPVDPNASWARRLKELILAFGLKPKGGNLATIQGKECLVRLREDTDLNGDYRPNIGKLMPLPVAQPEADEDEDDEGTNGLSDLTRAQLKALIKENDLDITVKKSMSDDELRELVQEEMEDEEEDDEDEDDEPEAEEDEDDEEEDDDEPEAEEDNYDSMSPKALRQELKDRELETKGAKAVLIARLRTDDVEEPV